MRVLIGCLLWCCTSSAQDIFPLKDSSIVKTIDLPAAEPFDTSHSWHRVSGPYVYIVSDKDLYDHFDYETTMKFYKFNFADYHILGEQQCSQCKQYCHHDEGQTACHRNACNKEWVWVMRENKKAFTEVPVTTLPGHEGHPQFKDHRSFYLDDTLVKSVAGTSRADWYTTGHGDCHAWFTYSLVTDKYHPVLLLKERNYWGGCRAGGSVAYTLSFSMPAGVLYTLKNTILMKNYGDGN